VGRERKELAAVWIGKAAFIYGEGTDSATPKWPRNEPPFST